MYVRPAFNWSGECRFLRSGINLEKYSPKSIGAKTEPKTWSGDKTVRIERMAAFAL